MKKVKVWINRNMDRFADGYKAGDALMPALEFHASVDDSDDDILEMTYVALNISPNPPTFGTLSQASILQYHLHFPSLSMGDVIDIDGNRYACEPVGWKRIWSDDIDFGICSICRHQRTLHLYGGHGVCADCMQGDPTTDLGLLYDSEGL